MPHFNGLQEPDLFHTWLPLPLGEGHRVRAYVILPPMKRLAILIIFSITLSLLSLFPFSASPLYSQERGQGLPASGGGELVVLTDRDYFPAALKAINDAKSSIYLLMYMIEIRNENSSDPVYQLTEALVKAHHRGVKVKVIIESEKSRESMKAFEILKNADIDAAFDDPYYFTHDKVLVVDSFTSIVGSHNWSTGALTRNHETSVLIRSKEVAEELISHIRHVRLTQAFYEEKDNRGVSLPSSFFTGPKSPGATLYNNHAEQLFNLYLLLLKDAQRHPERSEGSARVVVDYERLGKILGLSRENASDKKSDYYKYYYRDNLRRFLGTLDNDYKLVKYTSKTDTVEILPFPKPADLVAIPLEYWTYGWDKKLSFGAKYFYLISLREAKRSGKDFPWWQISVDEIGKTYGMTDKSVTDSTVELRRFDVLEVYRQAPKEYGLFKFRHPNKYLLKELYSEEDLKNGIADLERRYGKKLVASAREMSTQIDEPNDLGQIETFITLVQMYGIDKVKAANSKTAALAPNNAKRHVGYTITILEGK